MAIQDVLNPFVWGQGGAQLTPEQIAQRQAVAKGLLSSAIDTSPTAGGWASVLAKTLAGGMAGYDMRRADDATTQNAKDSQSIIARMLGGMAAGGTPAPAATPGVAPSSSSIPMPGAAGEMAATSPGISAPDNIKSLIASNVPSDMQPYVTNLIDKESGFDPNAVSPTGATGLAQFTRGTGRQYGLISDQGDIRKDPVANLNALVALTNDNRAGLTQALGRAPTDGELALAHQQGLQGAIDLLSGKAVPAGNLAVNNIDPNSDPRTAANKIMQFYGGAGGASAGTQVAQVAQASAPAAPVTQSINPAIIQALSNPYISDQARSVAGALLQQDFQSQQMTAKAQQARQQAAYEAWLKQQDPAYQAQLAMTKAQTDQIVNPRMSPAEQATNEFNNRKFAYEQEKDKTISPKDQADLDMSKQRLALEQQNSQLTNDVRDFNFAKQNGYQGDFAQYQIDLKRAGAARTNVDTGTIPQGYQAVRDANGNLLRYDPVPGGPADTSKKDAAAADSKQTFTDVITNAADLARSAYKTATIPTTGLIGRTAGELLPSTNAAEVRRQVGALKSNATIENLNAMRQQSPTGGALGNVTEGEGKMLAAKAGTLDPDSPNFLRDLDDYERTLLRIVHGKDAGDKIYSSVRGDNTQGGDGAIPTGVSPDIWSVMTPEEKALWQKK